MRDASLRGVTTFDGDEGNIHVLQTLDARAEAQELMSVTNCTLNAQSNKPTMGIVFNGPVAAMLLTQPETTVSPGDFYDSLSYLTQREQLASLEARMNKYNVPYTTQVEIGRRHYVVRNKKEFDLVTDPKGHLALPIKNKAGVIVKYDYPAADDIKSEPITETHFSGRALFSALFPEDLSYEGPKGVIIQEGVLTSGVITRNHIGPERGSIIHSMILNYSTGRFVDFMTDTTFLLNRWFSQYGFSIGISSCLVEDPEFKKESEELIERARMFVTAMGAEPDNPLEAEKWEEQILAYIGGPANVIADQIHSRLPKTNALNIAALSGAKGKTSNLVQIAFFVGQQHLDGRQIKAQMTYGTRCLPWFFKGEESLEAHGFCTSSFLKGLSPSEMYFNMMAGRESMMGVAVSTSESGFMHRKAVKTLQDVKTTYDGSVRGVDNTIFQYIYGDDGFTPTRLQLVETKKSKFLSFIDIKAVSKLINQRYGF